MPSFPRSIKIVSYQISFHRYDTIFFDCGRFYFVTGSRSTVFSRFGAIRRGVGEIGFILPSGPEQLEDFFFAVQIVISYNPGSMIYNPSVLILLYVLYKTFDAVLLDASDECTQLDLIRREHINPAGSLFAFPAAVDDSIHIDSTPAGTAVCHNGFPFYSRSPRRTGTSRRLARNRQSIAQVNSVSFGRFHILFLSAPVF